MFEADPVDPFAVTARIAIAKLDPPRGRIILPHELERSLPRVVLAVHAPRLPPADETDVEEDGIVERWDGNRPRFRTTSRRSDKHNCYGDRPSHRLSI